MLDDGSIIVYDNGNGRSGTLPGDPTNPTFSRAVIDAVDDAADPSDWSATQVRQHRIDDVDGRSSYAFFVGDADQRGSAPTSTTRARCGSTRSFPSPLRRGHGDGLPDGVDRRSVISCRAERTESFYVGPLWQP